MEDGEGLRAGEGRRVSLEVFDVGERELEKSLVSVHLDAEAGCVLCTGLQFRAAVEEEEGAEPIGSAAVALSARRLDSVRN